MTPIILSQEISSVPSIVTSSTQHRDGILALAAPIKEVKSQEQLETAVKVLAELAAIAKETESARKTIKEPVLKLGKQIDAIAADHVAKVEKETLRLKGLVNHWQTLQLREKEERERKALADQREAQRIAEEAQRKIEAATNEDAKLDAQLELERAKLAETSAEQQLSIPTNTPRGMTTRVRFDFQITDAVRSFGNDLVGTYWSAKEENETLKFDRAGFLKFLNSEAGRDWTPKEGEKEVNFACGIRIFRDVSVSVRA